jgi:parvulin-like peptidyl-prolyl isomerase
MMKRYNWFVILILAVAALTLLAGGEVIEAIVAIVNDDIITLSQYKNQHEALYQMLRARLQGEEFQIQYRRARKELLDTMITELLLLQEARKRGINVDEQVKLAIENIKEENGFNSDEELRLAMRQQGIDFETWKNQMKENIMKQGVIVTEVDRSIVLDDAEIVNYYKLHPEEFTEPTEYRLRAIHVSATNRSDEEVEERKKEIKSRIAAGEEFAVLAGIYSEGPEKESQGDLGTFKKGELENSVEQAVEKLKIGEISPWLKVKDGWYLLRLEERKEERIKPFEEVRKDIEEKLFTEKREKKLKEFIERLKEQSYIKIINPNPLGFDLP